MVCALAAFCSCLSEMEKERKRGQGKWGWHCICSCQRGESVGGPGQERGHQPCNVTTPAPGSWAHKLISSAQCLASHSSPNTTQHLKILVSMLHLGYVRSAEKK